MNVLFKMTEFSIHMREPQEIPTMYRKIVDHKDSFLITKADLNVRIETCVIALAMLHKQIMAREDMCKKLKKLLSRYSDFFLHYSDCKISFPYNT